MNRRRCAWVLCSGLLMACAVSQPVSRTAEAPTLLLQVPLASPGVLRGPWLEAGRASDLVVESTEESPSAANRLEPFGGRAQDVYRLTVQGSPTESVLFRAAYGKFSIRGVDVDGDGLWEIALEHAIGRGTFATTRELLVLRRQNESYVAVLREELVEYIWARSAAPDGPGRDPLIVERGYTFVRSASGQTVVRLELGPVPDLSSRILSEEQLRFVQRPRVDLAYDPALTRFEVVDFLFVTVPGHSPQERGS